MTIHRGRSREKIKYVKTWDECFFLGGPRQKKFQSPQLEQCLQGFNCKREKNTPRCRYLKTRICTTCTPCKDVLTHRRSRAAPRTKSVFLAKFTFNKYLYNLYNVTVDDVWKEKPLPQKLKLSQTIQFLFSLRLLARRPTVPSAAGPTHTFGEHPFKSSPVQYSLVWSSRTLAWRLLVLLPLVF